MPKTQGKPIKIAEYKQQHRCVAQLIGRLTKIGPSDEAGEQGP